MGTKLTADKLIQEIESKKETGKEEDTGFGKAFDRIIGKLEESGRLDQLIDAVLQNQGFQPQTGPKPNPKTQETSKETGSSKKEVDVDADQIIEGLKMIYDIEGNISLKDLIKLTEKNKSKLNWIIKNPQKAKEIMEET